MYKKKTGYELVLLDFLFVYPTKDLFMDLWPKYRNQILHHGIMEAKNKKKKETADILSRVEANDEDNNLEGVLALHALFFLLPNKNKMHKQCLKKVIFEGPPGEKVDSIIAELAHQNGSFSPVIIYYCNEDKIPIVFHVCVNGLSYEVKYLTTALDIFFKLHFIFDLSYMGEGVNFLTFIQHFFFNIHLQNDLRSSNIMNLMIKIDESLANKFSKRILEKDFD